MQILSPHDQNGWITAVVCNRWVMAKVYNLPSTFGINNGRVSKLSISKNHTRNPSQNYFDQMCYNYDRGLDFDNAPEGLVNSIVTQLEKLPLLKLDNE